MSRITIPDKTPFTIAVWGATDLTPMDKNGTSDPYCQVTYNKSSQRTSTINKNLNPVWNTKNVFTFKYKSGVDKVLFSVFDDDYDGDDAIGSYELDLTKTVLGSWVNGMKALATTRDLDAADKPYVYFSLHVGTPTSTMPEVNIQELKAESKKKASSKSASKAASSSSSSSSSSKKAAVADDTTRASGSDSKKAASSTSKEPKKVTQPQNGQPSLGPTASDPNVVPASATYDAQGNMIVRNADGVVVNTFTPAQQAALGLPPPTAKVAPVRAPPGFISAASVGDDDDDEEPVRASDIAKAKGPVVAPANAPSIPVTATDGSNRGGRSSGHRRSSTRSGGSSSGSSGKDAVEASPVEETAIVVAGDKAAIPKTVVKHVQFPRDLNDSDTRRNTQNDSYVQGYGSGGGSGVMDAELARRQAAVEEAERLRAIVQDAEKRLTARRPSSSSPYGQQQQQQGVGVPASPTMLQPYGYSGTAGNLSSYPHDGSSYYHNSGNGNSSSLLNGSSYYTPQQVQPYQAGYGGAVGAAPSQSYPYAYGVAAPPTAASLNGSYMSGVNGSYPSYPVQALNNSAVNSSALYGGGVDSSFTSALAARPYGEPLNTSVVNTSFGSPHAGSSSSSSSSSYYGSHVALAPAVATTATASYPPQPYYGYGGAPSALGPYYNGPGGVTLAASSPTRPGPHGSRYFGTAPTAPHPGSLVKVSGPSIEDRLHGYGASGALASASSSRRSRVAAVDGSYVAHGGGGGVGRGGSSSAYEWPESGGGAGGALPAAAAPATGPSPPLATDTAAGARASGRVERRIHETLAGHEWD